MSDHYTTQSNHRIRVLDLVRDVFSWVKLQKMSHKQMLNMLNERVYEHNSWQRLTQVNQAYVRGVIDTRIEQINQTLEWRVYHPDHGHVRRDNYAILEGKWSEVDGDMGAHFWPDTDKVWSGHPNVFELYDLNPEYGYV